MRATSTFVLLFGVSLRIAAESVVTIPWPEFKALYAEQLRREILESLGTTLVPDQPQTIDIIDGARYALTLQADIAHCEAVLSGRVVSGRPEPIPLFGPEAAIGEVHEVTGGILLCDKNGAVVFLPDDGAPAFRLAIRLSFQPREDGGSKSIDVAVPHALVNTLTIATAPDLRLIEVPGLPAGENVYHLAPGAPLRARYAPQDTALRDLAPDLDTIARVTVQESRLLIAASFVPARALPESMLLRAPAGATLLSSSLRPSWIKHSGGAEYTIAAPGDERGPFRIEFALDIPRGDGEIAFALPEIAGNTGAQGRFVLDEPDDAEVRPSAPGLVSHLPVERLGKDLAESVRGAATYHSAPPDSPITLTITRFKTLRTAPVVLDAVHALAVFEENGNVLSVIALDLPPELGPRLRLAAVPDAEIWSLTVNGTRRDVHTDDAGAWIVPLEGGKPSRVELAYLRRGPKLALEGRLEALIPETGLPARSLRVAIGLPDRVELLFVEGPVNPDIPVDWSIPAGFGEARSFFSSSFHQGEAMTLALAYKEPVKQPAN